MQAWPKQARCGVHGPMWLYTRVYLLSNNHWRVLPAHHLLGEESCGQGQEILGKLQTSQMFLSAFCKPRAIEWACKLRFVLVLKDTRAR
ncbi:hypothetical protein DPMN_193796 [Dreissena polymorpha]|uniref:Uncharacterized protein n=1 Tax=Dreissena polymorpha TaxID=45954 RepID=A0A9D3Y693_DREPO|nr:hypothetical protein DPMN_193796 [Dreissena polymorpha]